MKIVKLKNQHMKSRIKNVLFALVLFSVLSCKLDRRKNHNPITEIQISVCDCDSTYKITPEISIQINSGTFANNEQVTMRIENPKSAREYAGHRITLTDDAESNLRFKNVLKITFVNADGHPVKPQIPFWLNHKIDDDNHVSSLKKGVIKNGNIVWQDASSYMLSFYDQIGVGGRSYGPLMEDNYMSLSKFLDSTFRQSFFSEKGSGSFRIQFLKDGNYILDTMIIQGSDYFKNEIKSKIVGLVENVVLIQPTDPAASTDFIRLLNGGYIICFNSIQLSGNSLNDIASKGFSEVNYELNDGGWIGVLSPTVKNFNEMRKIEVVITSKTDSDDVFFLVNETLTVSYPLQKKKGKKVFIIQHPSLDDSRYYIFKVKNAEVELIKTIELKPGSKIDLEL